MWRRAVELGELGSFVTRSEFEYEKNKSDDKVVPSLSWISPLSYPPLILRVD